MSTQTVRPESGGPAQRRGPAVAGTLAGVAILAVLIAGYAGVRAAGSDDPARPAGAQPAASRPADAPPPASSAPEPSRPAPVDTPPALAEAPVVKGGRGTLSKLVVTPLVAGTGPAVRVGQTITANYVLVAYPTGRLIESSWQSGQPITTPIGTGAVIEGWEQGIPGQKVGSRVQLDVPAALAYGEGQGDLRFVVDILDAR